MLGFAYWAVFGLAVTIIGSVLSFILPERYAAPCGKIIIRYPLNWFLVYFKLAGLLILNDTALTTLVNRPGPLIIAPNHLALWDAVFLIAKIPGLTCLMKGAILRNPFLGGGARLAGYIPNDSTTQMLLGAAHRARKNAKLLLFPEGTRTKADAQWLNPLKGGVALLAKYTGAPIIPVYIRSSSRFLEKDRPLFQMPEFPIRVSIEVGEAIYFPKGMSVEHFRQQLEQHYMTELAKEHPLRRTANDYPAKILPS